MLHRIQHDGSTIHALVEGREITAAAVDGPHRVRSPKHLTDAQRDAVAEEAGVDLVPRTGAWISLVRAAQILGCKRSSMRVYASEGRVRTQTEALTWRDATYVARRDVTYVARRDVMRLRDHIEAGGSISDFDPMNP